MCHLVPDHLHRPFIFHFNTSLLLLLFILIGQPSKLKGHSTLGTSLLLHTDGCVNKRHVFSAEQLAHMHPTFTQKQNFDALFCSIPCLKALLASSGMNCNYTWRCISVAVQDDRKIGRPTVASVKAMVVPSANCLDETWHVPRTKSPHDLF